MKAVAKCSSKDLIKGVLNYIQMVEMLGLEIKSGYQYLPDDSVLFVIIITNNNNFNISDVELLLIYDESFIMLEGSALRNLGSISPITSRTIEFNFKTIPIGEYEIDATLSYKDNFSKKQVLQMSSKKLYVINPSLKTSYRASNGEDAGKKDFIVMASKRQYYHGNTYPSYHNDTSPRRYTWHSGSGQYYPGNTSINKNRRKTMSDDVEKLRDISDEDLTAIMGHRAPGSDYPSTHPPLSEIGEPERDKKDEQLGMDLIGTLKQISKENINKEILNCFCKILYYYPMCLQREFKLSVYISQLKEEIDKIKEKELKTSPTEPVNFEINKQRFFILKIVTNVFDVSPNERKISFDKNINSVNFKLLPKIVGAHVLDVEIYYEKEIIKEINIPIIIQEKYIVIPVFGHQSINITPKQEKYFSFLGTAFSILGVIINNYGLIIIPIIFVLYYFISKKKPSMKIQDINFNFSWVSQI